MAYVYCISDTSKNGGVRHWLSVAAAVILLLASAAGLALWQGRQMSILSVQTGSMAPLLQPGDAVIVRKAAASQLRPGDIVSAYVSDASDSKSGSGAAITTHRIVTIDPAGRIITQGDANVSSDPPLDPALLVGRAERHIANAGYFIDFIHSRAGLVMGVYLPAIVLAAIELRRLTAYLRPAYRHSVVRRYS